MQTRILTQVTRNLAISPDFKIKNIIKCQITRKRNNSYTYKADQYELVCDVSNGVISNDLE